ncbi:MAG: hypothetical protein HXX80_05355 [Nitrososphaerales archaeon]|nr:hypothetical protein [Nitrososphaerales archaeon]
MIGKQINLDYIMNYIPPPPESIRKNGFRFVVFVLILGILVGSVAGYGLSSLILSPEVGRWTTLYGNKVTEFDHLQDSYDQLCGNYTILNDQLTEINGTLSLFEKQTEEVFYFRMLPIYNYKSDEYWYAWYKVRSDDHYHYRFDVETHTPAYLEDRVTEELISRTANSWSDTESDVIEEIANDLWQISQDDEELFVNLVAQLVHQMCYNVTLYTKYPLETMAEGSGDCDNLAVLTASIILAGGLDVILLLVEANGGGHCMLAVSLSSSPDDLYDYGRDSVWYYEYNGEEYWLIEATWGDPGGDGWVDPATPNACYYVGAFVGDNPWESLDVVSVIHPNE